MKRRTFLQGGAAALIGAGLPRPASSETALPPAKTRIVKVHHAEATNDEGEGNPDLVREMVHRSVRELSGKASMEEAWASFVKPGDRVGIKVNVRAGRRLSVQPPVTQAIVEGLQSAGVPEENILIWDAWNKEFPVAGYTLNESDKGVRCHGSDHGALKERRRADQEEARLALKPYFSETPVTLGGKPVWLTRILTDEITALINVAILKEHTYAGVALSMKNHYGSILNPSDLHNDCCNPFLAELSALPVIRDKTRLIFIDALRGVYAGGPYLKPQYLFRPNAFVAGTDTVAVDTLGLRMIEDQRRVAGEPPIGERAKHIATAATMGLGVNDWSRIDLREIDLSTAGKEEA